MNNEALPFVLNEVASILLVDDDPILREFGVVSLSTEAVDVETAADGLFALERLEHRNFDILLVDLEMPRLDGFGLLERLRSDQRWCGIPVIVVTGREDIAAIDRAYRLGATSFTVKPINWRLLSYQIRFVLRAQHAERQSKSARRELCSVIEIQDDTVEELLALCDAGLTPVDLDGQRALVRTLQSRLRDLRSRPKNASDVA